MDISLTPRIGGKITVSKYCYFAGLDTNFLHHFPLWISNFTFYLKILFTKMADSGVFIVPRPPQDSLLKEASFP